MRMALAPIARSSSMSGLFKAVNVAEKRASTGPVEVGNAAQAVTTLEEEGGTERSLQRQRERREPRSR
jgi:hypothetical protein